MKVLILGGTHFLGRHLVELFQTKDYEMTLFNRGKTNSELFPEISRITGDRYTDFKLLDQDWDVVIDLSGYKPENQEDIVKSVPKAKHFIFISTCSVYDLYGDPEKTDESAQLVETPEGELVLPDHYGALKLLCERAVEASFKGKVTILRPGLIVGPYDSTNRFPYWPKRIAEGGEILAPISPNLPCQFIDARDICDFIDLCIQKEITGTYNLMGPQKEILSLGDFLQTTAETLQSNCEFKWASEEFLKSNQVKCWTGIPLFVYDEIKIMMMWNNQKAIEAGLVFRSISETIIDTQQWYQNIDPSSLSYQPISREKESELLLALQD